MDNKYPIISLLEKEKLNTLTNFYVGNVYKVEVDKDTKAIFKFFVSFPESFHIKNIDIGEKEKTQIDNFLSTNRIENGKTYTFEFRYSDFFEVDFKVL